MIFSTICTPPVQEIEVAGSLQLSPDALTVYEASEHAMWKNHTYVCGLAKVEILCLYFFQMVTQIYCLAVPDASSAFTAVCCVRRSSS